MKRVFRRLISTLQRTINRRTAKKIENDLIEFLTQLEEQRNVRK